MAWRRPGDKPLSEPMMLSLLTHICVTRPQWVNLVRYGSKTSYHIVWNEALSEVNLHRLISAAIGRWWPLTQPNYHFSPGGKSCALASLNIIPKFPKEKYKFLSEFSSKSNTFVCSICMIAKGYKVFPWKLCQSKNSVCDESPPKRRTVAETFAWRLKRSTTKPVVAFNILHEKAICAEDYTIYILMLDMSGAFDNTDRGT